jgi:hypothetical protein
MNDIAAIAGQLMGYRTLADGTLRLTVDLSEVESQHFHTVFKVHMQVAVAPINYQRPSEEQQDYGKYAEALYLSVFFGTPEVWKATGSDEQFLAYVRTQKCLARSGQPCDPKTPPSEACHVWRLAAGAGKGVKPPYSAIPMCHGHHVLQHQHGEDAIGGRAYMLKMAQQCRREWVWSVIKDDLGVASMRDAPPAKVYAWCRTRGVERYLPAAIAESVA